MKRREYYNQFEYIDLDAIYGRTAYQIDSFENVNTVIIVNTSTNAFLFVNNAPIRPGFAFVNNLVFFGQEDQIFSSKIIVRKGKVLPGITTFNFTIIKKTFIS